MEKTTPARVASWLDKYGNSSTWYSTSGQPVTGAEVAAHLEAATVFLSEDTTIEDRKSVV